jgi:seryl-tRNA synthetase
MFYFLHQEGMATMPPKKKAASPAVAGDKPKRRVLTSAERIAKLEADLAAARERAAAGDKKKIDKLLAQRAKLIAKVEGLTKSIDELTEQLNLLGHFDDGDVSPGIEDVELPLDDSE